MKLKDTHQIKEKTNKQTTSHILKAIVLTLFESPKDLENLMPKPDTQIKDTGIFLDKTQVTMCS